MLPSYFACVFFFRRIRRTSSFLFSVVQNISCFIYSSWSKSQLISVLELFRMPSYFLITSVLAYDHSS